jgi:hypothetical protein
MDFLMLIKFGVVIYESLINQWGAILISKTIMTLVT